MLESFFSLRWKSSFLVGNPNQLQKEGMASSINKMAFLERQNRQCLSSIPMSMDSHSNHCGNRVCLWSQYWGRRCKG